MECVRRESQGLCSVTEVDQAWRRYLRFVLTVRADPTMNYRALERVLTCSG